MCKPKSEGGRGGLIPAEYQGTMLNRAREDGISLNPEDFFCDSGERAVPTTAPQANVNNCADNSPSEVTNNAE